MLNGIDRDRNYWNQYYKKDEGNHEPSLFAQYVYDVYLAEKKVVSVLDLGCGNGRDSEFFLKKGLTVKGIDASDGAISVLEEKYSNCPQAEFECADFVQLDKNRKYDCCYSRFSIHAIDENQENELLSNVFDVLNKDGMFFIEARTVYDELYKKGEKAGIDAYIYNGHYRRFLRMGRLINKMETRGFVIDYAAEKRGFAPFNKENPIVMRVVGKRHMDV